MLVLEGVPENLAKEISETISIPTIGIGAGRYTDGQVLVYHDLLGQTEKPAKFVKEYTNLNEIIVSSIKNYINDVKEGKFPERKHTYLPLD